MTRPTGTPGTLHLANDYPAVMDHDEQLWALIGGEWIAFAWVWHSEFEPDDVPEQGDGS